MDYDVIVVGAGPAGATAAYFLGEAGLKVAVVEKKHLPRYKACGGGLSLEFLREQFPFSFDTVVDIHVRRVHYRFLDIETVFPVRPGTMAMVMRDRFDRYILEQAKCELREGTPVRQVEQDASGVTVTLENGETLTGSYLIGADGANSTVAHAFGLRRKRLIPAIEVEAAVPDSVYQRYEDGPLFLFKGPRYGYLWVFPKSGCLSVGVAGLNPKRGELQSTLEQEMRALGIPLDRSSRHGHSIPLYDSRTPVLSRRVFLVGDAAGTADPFSGEGIRPAIKSGRLAAEAIIAGHPEKYSRSFKKQIGRKNLHSVWTANVFYSLKELCLVLGAANPITTEAILDMLADRGSALQVLGKSVLSLPYFAIGEAASAVAGLLGGAANRERALAAFFPETYGERMGEGK